MTHLYNRVWFFLKMVNTVLINLTLWFSVFQKLDPNIELNLDYTRKCFKI